MIEVEQDETPMKTFLLTLINEKVKIVPFKRFGRCMRMGRNKTIDIIFENYNLIPFATNFLEKNKKTLNIKFDVITHENFTRTRGELKSEYLEHEIRLKNLNKEINELTGYNHHISIPSEWYNYIESSNSLSNPYIILDCENSEKLYSYIKEEKYLLEDENTLREMWRSKEN